MSQYGSDDIYCGEFDGRNVTFNRNFRGYHFSEKECEALFRGADVSLYGLERPNGDGRYSVRGCLSWLADKEGNYYVGIKHKELLPVSRTTNYDVTGPKCYTHYDTIPKENRSDTIQKQVEASQSMSSYVIVDERKSLIGNPYRVYARSHHDFNFQIGHSYQAVEVQPYATDVSYHRIDAYSDRDAVARYRERLQSGGEIKVNAKISAYSVNDDPYGFVDNIGTSVRKTHDIDAAAYLARTGFEKPTNLSPYKVQAITRTPDGTGRFDLDCIIASVDGESPDTAVNAYISGRDISDDDLSRMTFVAVPTDKHISEHSKHLCSAYEYESYCRRTPVNKILPTYEDMVNTTKSRFIAENKKFDSNGRADKSFIIQTVTHTLSTDAVTCVYTQGRGVSAINAAERSILNSENSSEYLYIGGGNNIPYIHVDNDTVVSVHAVPVSKCNIDNIKLNQPVVLRQAGESDMGSNYRAACLRKTGVNSFLPTCRDFWQSRCSRAKRADALLDRLSVGVSDDVQYGV